MVSDAFAEPDADSDALIDAIALSHQNDARFAPVLPAVPGSSGAVPRSTAIAIHALVTSVIAADAVTLKSPEACANARNWPLTCASPTNSAFNMLCPGLKSVQHRSPAGLVSPSSPHAV